MRPIATSAVAAVKEAGRFVTAEFANERKLTLNKSLTEVVTKVDYDVQTFLERRLRAILAGSMVVTEEGLRDGNLRSDLIWVLDPIDGTTNLVHAFPHVAISVALVEAGRITIGIVYNPISGELFLSEKGRGAYLNDERIKVSRTRMLEKSLVGFGLPYDREKTSTIMSAAERVFLECQDIRRTGSAALDISYVACGRLDGFFELDLRPWDFCAGKVILEEAGGRISSWSGQSVDHRGVANILATNGYIHRELRGILEPIEIDAVYKFSSAKTV